MSKNKIESDRDNFGGNEESDIINNISKQNFLEWMQMNGFTEDQLKHFFQEKRISSIDQNRFNVILRKAKEETGISLIDAVLFLENVNNKQKKILSVLDEETRHILKHELAAKFRIKIERNMLYKIME